MQRHHSFSLFLANYKNTNDDRTYCGITFSFRVDKNFVILHRYEHGKFQSLGNIKKSLGVSFFLLYMFSSYFRWAEWSSVRVIYAKVTLSEGSEMFASMPKFVSVDI